MAIAFVAANQGSGNGVSNFTFSLNVGSAADRFVAVLAGDYSTGSDTAVTGVTYNGVSLTAGTEFTHANGSRRFRLYWGITSATGSNTVSVTYNNANSVVFAVAACWSGVDQTTPVRGGADATAQGASAAPSVTISSSAADTVANLLLSASNNVSLTASSPAVERHDPGTLYFVMDEPGGTSVTVDGTFSASVDWVSAAISLVAAGAAAPTLTGSITLDDLAPTGTLGLNPSSMTGSITLDAIAPTGTLGIAPGSVTTLPFSRNTGSRPTGLSGVALAVLSDDANMTRLAGATSLSQDGSGRINYTGAGLPSVGTSVLVVTREADGRLGLERYTVQ